MNTILHREHHREQRMKILWKDRVIGCSLLNRVKEVLLKEVSSGDFSDKKEPALLGKFIPGKMNRKDLDTYENLKKF